MVLKYITCLFEIYILISVRKFTKSVNKYETVQKVSFNSPIYERTILHLESIMLELTEKKIDLR